MNITATFNIKPLWDAYGGSVDRRLVEMAFEGHLCYTEQAVREQSPLCWDAFYAAWYLQAVEDERLYSVVNEDGQVVANFHELLMEMMDYCHAHLYEGTCVVFREIWKTHTIRRLEITALTDNIAYVTFHVNALLTASEVPRAIHTNHQSYSVHAMY